MIERTPDLGLLARNMHRLATMSSSKAPTDPQSALRDAILHARHLLPAQGPIGEFIHHNTLHAYQHLAFHDALERAGAECDAEIYWPESKFRASMVAGHLGPVNLEAALDERYAQASRAPEARALVHDEPVGPLTRRGIERLMLRHDVIGADVSEVEVGDADPGLLALHGAARRLLEGASFPPSSSTSTSTRHVEAPRTHRDYVLALGGADPATRVDATLVRFLGAYLDDGMARWSMAKRETGLLACFSDYLGASPTMLHGFERRALARLRAARAAGAAAASGAAGAAGPPKLESKVPEAVLALESLAELGVEPGRFESYVARVMLELPGWAGMVAILSGTTTSTRAISPWAFDQLVAIRLVLTVEALRDVLPTLGFHQELAAFPAYARRHTVASEPPPARRVAALYEISRLAGMPSDVLTSLGTEFAKRVVVCVEAFDSLARRRTFLAAMEHAHLHATVSAVAGNRDRPAQPESRAPRFQVMFCIDDREEGIRRHFEELDPRHVTYGVAGFFGIAMSYQSFDDPNVKAQCPIVVTPAHSVVERPAEAGSPEARRRARIRRLAALAQLEVADASRSFVRGLFVTPLLGLLAIIPLALRIFFPHRAEQITRGIEHWFLPEVQTDLVLHREDPLPGDEVTIEQAGSLLEGFTLEERVDRVATTLENVGLVDRFAPLVALFGHGASTVNNPHHSAYDCGACGGRNGGPNARAFAMMANDPAVRAGLEARGIRIPDKTWFLGGLHDTTTDGIAIFDLDRVPGPLREDLTALRRALDSSRARSAHERCRRFEHAPRYLGAQQALHHVEERSVDLSQARPELGHATNAACIVGRRALSRGIFLDRRAFLVSYDPAIDHDSTILQRILNAVVPVGAGINLEYYFSTVDPDRWGCGTKLPHNLSGLIGVMEGGTGDLRTGLPREMIEVHEPVRLLCIVDASSAALLTVAGRLPEVREVVANGWVRLVSVDPETGATELFGPNGFEPLDLAADPKLPVVRSAVDWYRGRRDSLPPARIAPSSSLAGS